MTRFGTILFTVLGLLFAGGVALMIWLALRGTANVRATLAQTGWTVRDGQSPVRWTALRTRDGLTTTVEQRQGGVKTLTVWTEVRVPADTRGVEVLITPRAPALLSADGALSSWLGQRTPPKWTGRVPAFGEACDAWATDSAAGERWLTPAAQALLLGATNLRQLVGVHIVEGTITARIAGDLDDPKLVEEVCDLVARLSTLHTP
jgi:hypothetical protein